MAPRQFPLPYHVGIDICHVPRITRLLTGPSTTARTTRLLKRIYHPLEQRQFADRFNGSGAQLGNMGTHLDTISKHIAGRWAAKEAVIKATKPRRIFFRDVVVLSDTPSGGVYAVVLDELKRTPSHSLELDTSILDTQPSDAVRSVDDLQGQVVNVSISHDGDYACAVCVAPTAPPSPTAQDILEAGVLDP